MSVASIFGVWKTRSLDGCTGRDLVAASCVIYGSRTTLVLFNTQSNRVEEHTILQGAQGEKWVVTQPNLTIKPSKASLFSPGLRSCYEMPELLEAFKTYSCKGMSLRHSGAMGYDCYQILLKGQGLYTKFDTIAHASNLHLIYEILPMGLLIEKAGGSTNDGTGHSVLDTKIKGFD
jgi:sedoheptulose-bisphosphatase